MTLFPLDSSIIRAYGWQVGPRQADEDGRTLPGRVGLLELEFNTGARWYYFNVLEAVFDSFMMARSKGSFFRQHILHSFKALPAEEVERLAE